MPWWGWIVIGALLLGSELAFIDAQFYLVFLGTAALIVGMFDLGGIELPIWAQWLTFAALSIISMLLFRRKLYGLLRQPVADIPIGPTGDVVAVPIELAPGAECRIDYRGSTWDARNAGEQTIAAGSQARIVRVDGLTLKIAHQ